MDAFLDSETWHQETFMRSAMGYIWRVWFDGNLSMMQRLIGDEPEYYEPIRTLRRREQAEATAER